MSRSRREGTPRPRTPTAPTIHENNQLRPDFSRCLLELQIVDASGALVASGTSEGSSGDFVTVEKGALFALVDDMGITVSPGIQRRVNGIVETESFDALVAYGKGRRIEDSDDTEAALAHFEEASELDPAFDLALEHASDMRVRLERAAAQTSDAAMESRTAILQRALAKTPDEMGLSKRTKSLEQLTELFLRFTLLEELGHVCQARDEMTHFLVRHDGQFMKTSNRELSNSLEIVGSRLGLGRKLDKTEGDVDPELQGEFPNLVARSPQPRPAGFIASPTRRDITLVSATLQCAGASPRARLAGLRDLQRTVGRLHGVLDAAVPRGTTVDLELRLRIAREIALLDGATAKLDREITALETEAAALEVVSRERVLGLLADVREVAATRSRFLAALGPFDEIALQELSHARAKAAPEPKGSVCADTARPRDWEVQAERVDRLLADDAVSVAEQSGFLRAAVLPRTAYVLGCLDTHGPVVVHDRDEALAWADGLLGHPVPGRDGRCADHEAEARAALDAARATEDPDPKQVVRLVRQMVDDLLITGCSEPAENWKQNSSSPPDPQP
ncbi:MAG: hypothetical protein R3F61_31645 [Myxococcota bacterium]